MKRKKIDPAKNNSKLIRQSKRVFGRSCQDEGTAFKGKL